MALSKRQREMLAELSSICNSLGNDLDASATNVRKYIDRQEAHRHVYKITYGICVDEPENDFREENIADAEQSLIALKEIANRKYKDRNGN